MTKQEGEQKIRALCHVWAEETGLPPPPSTNEYSFSAFMAWLSQKGYGHYLNFRSTGGALYAAEVWFTQEFKQTWRE